MRSAMVGTAIALIMVATYFIIASIQVNSNLQHEVYSSLNEAIYQTERVLFDRKDSIKSNDEYLAELNTNLAKQIADGRECTVKVYGIDYTKGLLDVSIHTQYTNLWGNVIDVDVRRTMIIDKRVDE